MPYSPHLNEMENHSNMENEREGEQERERVKHRDMMTKKIIEREG